MLNTERLKDARDNLNITQKDMGKELNISASAYARYENETDNFPIGHLIKTCDILNISLDFVFNFVDFQNYDNVNTHVKIKECANRLKAFRKDINLTQLQLSNILKIDRSVISRYENGKQFIATTTLYGICKKYHISADYLVGKINKPKKYN